MGKVHGSLARAGKVKSQTPKVSAGNPPCREVDAIELQLTLASPGRTTREEEDTQGPCEEENHIHPPLRQRHDDRWQEEDEPEPDIIKQG